MSAEHARCNRAVVAGSRARFLTIELDAERAAALSALAELYHATSERMVDRADQRRRHHRKAVTRPAAG